MTEQQEHSSTHATAPLIVCATRGGEGSRAVQSAASARARDEGAHLRFVYVVDDTRYADVDPVLRPALRQELVWVGQTLLELARRRGRLVGASADIDILEGGMRQQIIAYLRQHQPLAFYLGAPRGTSANIFGDEDIEQFALEIEQDTGIDVMLIRPDDSNPALT